MKFTKYLGLLGENGREISGAGYQRQKIEYEKQADGTFGHDPITFPKPKKQWPAVTGYGIFPFANSPRPELTGRVDYSNEENEEIERVTFPRNSLQYPGQGK